MIKKMFKFIAVTGISFVLALSCMDVKANEIIEPYGLYCENSQTIEFVAGSTLTITAYGDYSYGTLKYTGSNVYFNNSKYTIVKNNVIKQTIVSKTEILIQSNPEVQDVNKVGPKYYPSFNFILSA